MQKTVNYTTCQKRLVMKNSNKEYEEMVLRHLFPFTLLGNKLDHFYKNVPYI